MKEFVSAVEDIEAEDKREAEIKALMQPTPGKDGEPDEPGLSREEAEQQVDNETYVEFKVDGRVMRAYQPHEGQLAFMLAALGRGQSQDQRFAAILNIMFESLREEDKDYLEGRLLTRDHKRRLSMKKVEGIFEYLMEEWFRPDVSGGGEALHDSV
jgi:hypothetical protein